MNPELTEKWLREFHENLRRQEHEFLELRQRLLTLTQVFLTAWLLSVALAVGGTWILLRTLATDTIVCLGYYTSSTGAPGCAVWQVR